MKKFVIGNLKMNILNATEREQYFSSFKNAIKSEKFSDTQMVICPPFVHLEKFAEKIASKNVSIGAQDVFWEEKGSFTGEVSAKMIKNLGAEYCIVGHSERRRYFGETSEDCNLKIKALVGQNIAAIYCVGESQEERDSGRTAEVVTEQIKKGFADLSALSASRVVVAYEPIWAVGSDKIPAGDDILEIKIILRKILVEMFGMETARQVKILYGGSVTALTVGQVCLGPEMDGVLVGRESLMPSELIKIAQIIDKD